MKKSFGLPLSVSIEELEENTALPFFDVGLNIVSGRHPDIELVNKFGRNTDIDAALLPVYVWDGGGVYSGFPVGDVDEFEVVSTSNADRGELVIQYLENPQSEAYTVKAIKVNGTIPVATGVSGHRLHTARYNNETENGFNAGVITVRHKNHPGHVFCRVPAGRSQSAVAAITVPAGHTGYIRRIFVYALWNQSAQIDGGLWIRDAGQSPRLRRPFSLSINNKFEETPEGGIVVLAGGDVMVRILNAAAQTAGLQILAGFDIIFVRNANA